MKVMLVNGSPHEHGCTDAALREVASALNADGIDTEIFWIGNRRAENSRRFPGLRKRRLAD